MHSYVQKLKEARLPDFVVIGAAKAGTTSLCSLLSQHPEIFFSTPKEPHYFSRVTLLDEKAMWYGSLFQHAKESQIVGEGSTSYSHPHRVHFAARRIADVIPECKIIYIVRHPIRRLESDWKMRVAEKRIQASLSNAIENNVSLVLFGLYWAHLSVYKEFFRDDQILVVFLEDFYEDPQRELSRILMHLGVSVVPIAKAANTHVNTAWERQTALKLQKFKRIPGANVMKEMLPKKWANKIKSSIARPRALEAQWEPSVYADVVEFIRGDSEKLLAYCEKNNEFWSWDLVRDDEKHSETRRLTE